MNLYRYQNVAVWIRLRSPLPSQTIEINMQQLAVVQLS